MYAKIFNLVQRNALILGWCRIRGCIILGTEYVSDSAGDLGWQEAYLWVRPKCPNLDLAS